jgi:hypothetical protein
MPSKKETIWRCQNYGSCPKADASTLIALEPEASFRCPECGCEEGIRINTAKKFPFVAILGGVGVLALVVIIGKLIQPPERPKRPPTPLTSTPTVLTDTRTAIDKQILVRPKSELFKSPNGAILEERSLKNFERFYVFSEKDGWIEVGDSKNNPLGWMKAEDAVEWPHSIVVEYGSPEKRLPVLFFRDDKELSNLVGDDGKRKGLAERYYQEIDAAAVSGNVLPGDHPVICIEPDQIAKSLYINPVLASRQVEVGGHSGRLLKVTAAGMDRGATEFSNPEYLKLLNQSRQTAKRVALDALNGIDFDLVFVVDMTGSMQPWVNGLVAAISNLSTKIGGNPNLSGRVKFGLWGYQDLTSNTGIQFRTKNWTPELLPPADFVPMIANVKVNKETYDSIPEDVFAGLKDAIGKTAWKSKNKFIVLIGDAPGHPPGDEGNSEYEIDAAQVRAISNTSDVQIVSLAILDSIRQANVKHHPELEKQFTLLSVNGNRPSAYLNVKLDKSSKATAESLFCAHLETLLSELVQQNSLREPQTQNSEPSDPVTNIAKGLLESAKVRVVSKIVDSTGMSVIPRDITGWVSDRDLIHPEIPALEPKLLVTRAELNKLLVTSQDLITALEKNKIIGGDFYDSILKTVAASASGDRSDRLKDKLPDFIQGLPYKSEFMEKSKDWWASAPESEKDRFLNEMKSKQSFYRLFNEDSSQWKSLNREEQDDKKVAAIPLSQLL